MSGKVTSYYMGDELNPARIVTNVAWSYEQYKQRAKFLYCGGEYFVDDKCHSCGAPKGRIGETNAKSEA